MRAYGVDTLDPRVSTRRVHVLLSMLPPEARRGGQDWSTEAVLLAGLIDQVAALTWVTLKCNGAKGGRKPSPVQVPPERRPFGGTPARRQRNVDGTGSGARPDGGGPRRSASWADAALKLAKMPGVEVIPDGG